MVSKLFTLLALPVIALCAPVNQSRATASLQAGKVNFYNNCPHSVSVQAFPGPGCSAGQGRTVAAGATWSDTLKECSGGNTALKVYKSGETKPMQFEYGLKDKMLWYDMSFIDCIKGTNDFSRCSGSAWAMRGNDKCHAWKCTGPDCCQQGYCDPYATAMAQQPTAGCGTSEGYSESQLGVIIELC